jgi:very-short-patch-repair endonuclease
VPLGPYIVDFVCFERQLILELDGGQHTLQRDYDAHRTRLLESQGFRLLRFWNYEVLDDWEAVEEGIWNALHAPPQPPAPPPHGRAKKSTDKPTRNDP